MKFDKYQQEYINYPLSKEGGDVLLVKAVAGAGKTTSTITKIEKLINDGTKPQEIVLTTFSNRMGAEVRKKLKKKNIEGVTVGTIHSIVYQKYREKFPKTTILTEWDTIKIIRNILLEVGITYPSKKEGTALTNKFLNYLSYYRANLLDVNNFSLWQFFSDTEPFTEKNFKRIYNLYEEFKNKNNFIDFDDLVSPKVWVDGIIDNDIKYVFHDEAQDGSMANHKTLENIFPKASYILIYDNMQKLYTFRYAYSEPMDKPEEYFGGKRIHKLNLPYNYRSDGNIIKVSNVYRELVDDLIAMPTRPETQGAVKLVTLETENQVGSLIAKTILELKQKNKDLRYKDFVVLVRKSNFIKSVLEPAFVRRNLPYKVKTPLYKKKFFEVPVNSFFLSVYQFLMSENPFYIYQISNFWVGIGESFKERLVKNPHITDPKRGVIDSFVSLLKRKFGNILDLKHLLRLNLFLKEYITANLKPSLFTEKQINTALRTFNNFMKQLMDEEGITDPDELLFNIIQRINEYDDETSDKIELTTVFQYKGHENKVVFVTDICDTSFEIDESTYPIFYTALTRAINNLFVINYQHKHNFKLGTIRVKPYPKFMEMVQKLKENTSK